MFLLPPDSLSTTRTFLGIIPYEAGDQRQQLHITHPTR
jgi:hypothetical protein